MVLWGMLLTGVALALLPEKSFVRSKKRSFIFIIAYLAVKLSVISQSNLTGSFVWWDVFILLPGFIWVIKRMISFPLIKDWNFEFEIIYRLILLAIFGYYFLFRNIPVRFKIPSLEQAVFTMIGTILLIFLGIFTARGLKFLTLEWRKIDLKSSFILTAYMSFLVALSQEILFRGLILGYLLQFIPYVYLSLLLSAIIFGLAHINYAGPKMVVLATLAGIGYGLLYIVTDNILCPIIMHVLTNFFWKLYMRPVARHEVED